MALHTLESIIQQPPDRWMTYTRMTHYQSMLLTKRAIFAPPVVLNPATLLPETDDSSPTHHCADILAEETGTRNDLKDQISLGLRVQAGTPMAVASRLKVSRRWGQQYSGGQKASNLGQQPP